MNQPSFFGKLLIVLLGILVVYLSIIGAFFLLHHLDYHVTKDEMAKYGASGDFINGYLTPIISVISAIFIYLALKQQVDELKVSVADRNYDRCMKLIDEMDKYLSQIILIEKTVSNGNKIQLTGNDAIDNYIDWHILKDTKKKIENKEDFERKFFIYLANIDFTLDHIEKLTREDKTSYAMLCTKLLFTIPSIIGQYDTILNHKDLFESKEIHQSIMKSLESIKASFKTIQNSGI